MTPVQQIEAALESQGFQCIHSASPPAGNGRRVVHELYASGANTLLARRVQVRGGETIELFAPVSSTNKISDDIAAIERLAGRQVTA